MKKTATIYFGLLLWLISSICEKATAQQLPNYTQYLSNYFGLNPASGGRNDCVELRGGQRRQWVGFENAPVTTFFSINGRIKNKAKPYVKNMHVIGAYFENDRTGPLGVTGRTNFFVNYSFHLALGNEIYASAGVFAGLMQYGFSIDKITLNESKDDAINASRKVILIPDINPGLMLYGKNFFVGYSLKNAVGNKLDPVFGFGSRLIRHHYATAGIRLNTHIKEISFLPSINTRVVGGSSPSLDATLLVDYDGIISAGLMYRKSDAIAGLVQVKYKKYFLGYSYDFSVNRTNVGHANTHEFMLGYKICPAGKDDFEEGIRCWAYQ